MIIDQFNTKQELDHFLASLSRFKLDLFKYSSEELEEVLHNNYDIVFVSTFHKLLQSSNVALTEETKLQVESILENFETEMEDVEVLKITISFSPTARFQAELQNWISKNISPNTLLDLTVRNEIIGGAEIVYKGNYQDLTISNKLENYNFAL